MRHMNVREMMMSAPRRYRALGWSGAVLVVGILVVALVWHMGEASGLATVEAMVRNRFSSVEHVTPEELAKLSAAGSPIVLFDVREEEEFSVSHLANAVRVAPNMEEAAFLNKFASAAKGKTAVFYCSVGVRSSQIAARVGAALKGAGTSSVYNLSGGVFRWHNEDRPLTDEHGATTYVHPFDAYWGRLVSRRQLISTVPRQEATTGTSIGKLRTSEAPLAPGGSRPH